MRENRSNKSYNSRLTRWVDRLLPFDFSTDHLPGSKMGLVDYISRDPQQKTVNISTYDEQFIVAKLDVIKRGAKRFVLNAENYVDFAARNRLQNEPQIIQIPLTNYAVNSHREIQNILQLRILITQLTN